MTELKRPLGLFQATMYGAGLILGAGIYVLIGAAAGLAGNAVWLSFILGAIIAAFTGLSYAELASMYPKAAAEYVYVKRAFGSQFLAFVVGWLVLFSAIISASTVSLGFGGYLAGLLNAPVTVAAAVLILVLSVVNFWGMRETSWLNVAFTLVEASGLVFIIWIGFTYAGGRPVDLLESPSGLSGILAAVTLVFVAYVGFQNVANIAEDTRNPTKVLPRALLLSLVITAVVYVLVALAAVRVVDWHQLAASPGPLAEVAATALGAGPQLGLAVIALFATTNTVLAMLVASSRILYGMAEQRSLPRFFAGIHSRTGTPWTAVFATMAAAAAFAAVGNIVTVANIAVFTIVITFAMVNLALIWLRYTEPATPRPFRVPVSIGRLPVLPVLGFVTSGIGAFQFDMYVAAVGIGVVGAGMLAYGLWTRTSARPARN